jgi:hypothetical protein
MGKRGLCSIGNVARLPRIGGFMNNVEQLFIRACKSRRPLVRINSVYRRYYLTDIDGKQRQIALLTILARLIDKYCPMSCADMIDKLAPCSDLYHDKALGVLVSRIRLAEVSRFGQLRTPAIFRKGG